MTTQERVGHHQADAERPVALPWLTVETALYLLLGGLALVSRFYALGARPLTAPEATQALHAWQAVGDPGGNALAPSPLLFAGQALAFDLQGASDGAARLFPSLDGTALVLLPYLLRHRLGRIGALVTSACLLISPTALFTSRDGSGEVLLLTAGLAAFIGLVAWVDFRRPGYLYLTAASAALALTAAPGVYTLIVALAVAFGLLALLGRRTGGDRSWASLRGAWQQARTQQEWLRAAVALFLGLLVLVPTVLLLHLEGVQAVVNLFPAWINRFAPWAGEQPWSYPLAVLALHEPLLLLFGLAGAILAFRQRDLMGRLSAAWAGVALLVALIAGGRGPGDVLLVVGPLALLAGRFIGQFLENVAARDQWIQDVLIVGVLLAIGVFYYVELATFAFRRQTSYLWLAVLSLGLAAGVFAL
ncbi:MAG: glycosyltransferase family 39 protein [Anaerolineae bacterium]|nr:MAG: glycosyltransferase family 39 protein [Anaerolineae bacterium]